MKIDNLLKILSAVTTVLLASAEVIKQLNTLKANKQQTAKSE